MSLKEETKDIIDEMDIDLETAEKELTKDFDDEDIDDLDDEPDDTDPDDTDPDDENHRHHKHSSHGKPIPYAPKNGYAPHLKHLYANYGGEVMPYINMFDLSLSYETSDIELLYHLCERINKMIDIINAENKYINRLTDWTEKKIHKLFKHQKKFENYLMALLEEFENEMDQKFTDFTEEIHNEIDEFETLVKEEITAMNEEIQEFEKDITERMENFENEVNERLDVMDKEITDFENEMKLRADNFENTINNALTEFETEMRTRADVFEQTMEKEQSNYENSMNERATDFESSITSQINEFETLITEMHNAFSDEWTSKLNDFENNMETRADTFEDNMETRADTFEDKLKDEWNDFKQKFSEMYEEYITDITNQWESFRSELAEEFKNLSDELLQEQNDYESKMNQKYEEFTDSIESYIEECCENVNARITEFEDEYNERLENTTRDEVDKVAEEYVNSAIFELIQSSEEFRLAISNVVNELLQESEELAEKIKDIVDEIMKDYDIDEKVKNFFDENFNTYLTEYLEGNEELLEIIDNEIASKVPEMLAEFLESDEFKEKVENIVEDMEWTEVDTSLTDAINLIRENKPRFFACINDEVADPSYSLLRNHNIEFCQNNDDAREDVISMMGEYSSYSRNSLTHINEATSNQITLFNPFDDIKDVKAHIYANSSYDESMSADRAPIICGVLCTDYIYITPYSYVANSTDGSFMPDEWWRSTPTHFGLSDFSDISLADIAENCIGLYNEANNKTLIFTFELGDSISVEKLCEVNGKITTLVSHENSLAYVTDDSNTINIINDIFNIRHNYSFSQITNEHISNIYDIYWTDSFLGVNFKTALIPNEIISDNASFTSLNDNFYMAYYPFSNYERHIYEPQIIDYEKGSITSSDYSFDCKSGGLGYIKPYIQTNTVSEVTNSDYINYTVNCPILMSLVIQYLVLNGISSYGVYKLRHFNIVTQSGQTDATSNFNYMYLKNIPYPVDWSNTNGPDIDAIICEDTNLFYKGGNSSSTSSADIKMMSIKNGWFYGMITNVGFANLSNAALIFNALNIDEAVAAGVNYIINSMDTVNSCGISNNITFNHNTSLSGYITDLRSLTELDNLFSF